MAARKGLTGGPGAGGAEDLVGVLDGVDFDGPEGSREVCGG